MEAHARAADARIAKLVQRCADAGDDAHDVDALLRDAGATQTTHCDAWK